jgi:subtilisin-like proprotein convertase family protein
MPRKGFPHGGAAVTALLPALALLVAPATLGAQAQGIEGGKAIAFAVSPALRDLPPPDEKPPGNEEEVKANPNRTVRQEVDNPSADSSDPVVQDVPLGISAIPGPILSFPGLSSDDNAALFGTRVMPPDTVGDVGPNHYVQMINDLFRVYSKSGIPLTPRLTLGSLWAAINPPCANANDGDPIVLYDPLADRWLLSQFCVAASPNTHQLIAVSQTPDPAGAYYLYDFMMVNSKFNDYPHFGVWHDAYYMTDNQFIGNTFAGAGVFAFERRKMLAGDPSAAFLYVDVENGNPAIGGMLPADFDGLVPPPAGAPGYFAYFRADEFGDPFDSLRLFEFRPNFAVPAASSFSERADSPLAVAAFDPRSPAGRDDIEQPPPANSGTFLDVISDRLMHRLAYRNFGDHESLVLTHTVNVSGVAPATPATHHAGIRYYELRRPLPGGSFAVHEQATFAPDADERWMGSAAMDNNGNLAVGYSVSSLITFPSIRYAGRLATDPPNGLFQGETTLLAGTGSQTATQSRWGDYSALTVDPADDCTFWYTTEYLTSLSSAISSFGWLTHIGTFSFPSCTPAQKGTISGVVRNALTGLPIAGATVASSNGFSRFTGGAGSYSMTVAAGSYDLTASAPNYLSDSALGVSAGDGATTVQDFTLTPVPVLMAAGGTTIAAETCAPGNGAIDPGETVSVNLFVKNTGTAGTTNLVATLLPGGGVTAPGPAQAYGVVAAGGPPVGRPFSFTAAGSCGGTLSAALQLQDGPRDLGVVFYTFTLGTLNPFSVPAAATSGDLTTPLPDVATTNSTIVVTTAGVISDLNVRVRLDHTFDGDLNLSLIGPDGTVVPLSSRRGGGDDNFGAGATSCAGTPTVFDDEAGTPISAGSGPFAGSFRPEAPLAAFDGKPVAGSWTLRITDAALADSGTLFCWGLEIDRRLYACCGVPGDPVVQKNAAAVSGESCHPANGAVDPGETVSVDFTLANAGSGATGDLVATLLATGGVQMPSAAQSYGAIQPGQTVTRTFSFVPAGSCGGSVTATLHLQDGPLGFGNFTFTFPLGTTQTTGFGPFANPGSIAIPATGTSGIAAPYPSTVSVSGIGGAVSNLQVRLNNVNHTFPDDIDILLVGPGGQKVILMSDAGGSLDLVGVNLTFDDSGPAVPDATLIASGTYRPTNFVTGDTFAFPAPATPFGSALSAFNGVNPNGTWSLFVTDDAGGDAGSIAGGWSLSFSTAQPICCTEACSLACPDPIGIGTEPNRCDAAVSFPFPAVTGICGTTACAPSSGSVFPLGSSNVLCTATTQANSATTCTFPVTVTDVQPPAISGAAATPSSLWPPDHTYRNVAVAYTVGDNCGPTGVACALTVASDEPLNGTGDGDTAPDWVVVDSHHVKLRAERSGSGDGRVYTLTVTCTDPAGRRSQATTTVTVPHDQ